jgi:flagellar protein FliO/FliZ
VGFLVPILSVSAQEESIVIEDPLAAEESHEGEEQASNADALREIEEGMSFASTADNMAGTGPSIWAAVRMILVLALVAAAIYGIVFLFKRSSKQTSADDPFLKILANAHLASNRYVHVVSVGNKAWLVGSSDGGVNVIGEIDDKDVINAMLLEESKKSAAEVTGRFPDFLGLLRRMGTPAGNRNHGADEIRKRRERLKGL